jgi:uncharacterized protein (TIGR03435 family)
MKDVSKVLLLVGAAITAVIPIIVGIVIAAPAQNPSLQAITRPTDIPKWEAVSIKPCGIGSLPEGQRGQGPGGPPFRFTPDRMTLRCMDVRTLINSAYKTYIDDPNMPGFQGKDDVLLGGMLVTTPVIGGSDWIDSQKYTIEAKAEHATARAVMQGPMLQVILEDRFQLKLHWETREVPVFALTVAKGGPKLHGFQEGSCTTWHLPDMGDSDFHGPPEPPRLPAGQRYCNWGGGVNGNIPGPPEVRLSAEGVTMDQLAKFWLKGKDNRKVVDRTGLKGKFDIKLEYAMDEEGRQRFARATGHPLSEIPTSPSIFTALQEQLGLRLEPAKAPVEHLVIDHVERPTEN